MTELVAAENPEKAELRRKSDIMEGKFDHINPYPGDAGIFWREDPSRARPLESEDEAGTHKCRWEG